ncbi:MAG: DUF3108 domain-containing protein [Pseudomarimonas sp.]
MTHRAFYLTLSCFGIAMLIAGATSANASELRAFTATYDVYIDGKAQGRSDMRLVEESPGQWLHTVEAKGTSGMARLSGFAATQTTRFQMIDGRPRLQSAQSKSELLIRSREVNTQFDWEAGVARWEGDLKAHERAPTPLADRVVNAGLLNVLLAVDSATAPAASRLEYRLYERGSAEAVDYTVGTLAKTKVPAGTYDTVQLRGERPAKKRVITAWYAANLPPTPVRLRQIEEGKPSYELKLVTLTQ